MAPWVAIFYDTADPESAMYNNFRVFGTGLLCVMGKSQCFEYTIHYTISFVAVLSARTTSIHS